MNIVQPYMPCDFYIQSKIISYICIKLIVMTSTFLLGAFGPQEIIIVLVIVLLLFGGRKIPELMRGLGKGMREFKDASANPEENKKNNATENKDQVS